MRKLLLLITVLCLLLTSCTVREINTEETKDTTEETTTEETDIVEETLEKMSLEEKVGQLFMLTPEGLLGAMEDAQLNSTNGEAVTAMTDGLKNAMQKYAPGGIILYYNNILDENQIKEYTSALHNASDLPLLIGIDEEGGRVARIGNNENFSVTSFGSMEAVGASENTDEAYNAGRTIGAYLHEYGFDLDFAPVADINSNPENRVIGDRAFGSDALLVSSMVNAFAAGLQDEGVYGCVKHFPGHGDTAGDTHEGFVKVDKTWDELFGNEIIPFVSAIKNDIPFVMAAHVACPEITGDNTPASMSYTLLTEKLRNELGFKGIIITDGMNMGAVTQNYSSAEAAVKAVNAGVDMILCPYDFFDAYNGIIDAVNSGSISIERIDESVSRILNIKLK